MKIIPMRDLIMVKKDDPDEDLGHGLVAPEQYLPKPVMGRVLAVGPEVKNFQLGDRVVFSRTAGTQLITGSGEVSIMDENDIIAGFLEEAGDV